MLNVIMLSGAFFILTLNGTMLSAIILNGALLGVIMLNGALLSVIMMSVMVPNTLATYIFMVVGMFVLLAPSPGVHHLMPSKLAPK